MSVELFNNGELQVTRYVGPAGGADRRRWQFTTPLPAGLAALDEPDVWHLIAALLRDLGEDLGASDELRAAVERRVDADAG